MLRSYVLLRLSFISRELFGRERIDGLFEIYEHESYHQICFFYFYHISVESVLFYVACNLGFLRLALD